MRGKLLKGMLLHMYEHPQCEECVHPHTSTAHACTDKQGHIYTYTNVRPYTVCMFYMCNSHPFTGLFLGYIVENSLMI